MVSSQEGKASFHNSHYLVITLPPRGFHSKLVPPLRNESRHL